MIENKLPVLLIVHNILTAAVFHHKSMYWGEQDQSQCVRWNHISTAFKILWGLEGWNVLQIEKKKLLWLLKMTLQSNISVLLSRICCTDYGKESLRGSSGFCQWAMTCSSKPSDDLSMSEPRRNRANPVTMVRKVKVLETVRPQREGALVPSTGHWSTAWPGSRAFCFPSAALLIAVGLCQPSP